MDKVLDLLDILSQSHVTWSLSRHVGEGVDDHYRVALFWGKNNESNVEKTGRTPMEALIEALAQLAYIVSRGLHR